MYEKLPINQIIEGDCLEVMAEWPDNCVDAIITDPPYGVGFQSELWDASIPDWLTLARRVAPIVVFTTAPTTQWDYPRPDWVCCWYRPASSARSQLRGGFNHWSPILIYGRPKFPVDSINLHAIANAYPKGYPHPCPKPERLMAWLVTTIVAEGGCVCDPFLGSGTTALAARRAGRHFIGIEKDHDYCEIARKRLREDAPLLAMAE